MSRDAGSQANKKSKKPLPEGELSVRIRESLELGPGECAFRLNPYGKLFLYNSNDEVPFRSLKPSKCTMIPANDKKKDTKLAAFMDARKEDGVPESARQVWAVEVNKIGGVVKYMSVLCYQTDAGQWVVADRHPFASAADINSGDNLMFVGPNGVSFHSTFVPKKSRVGSSYPYAVVGVANATLERQMDMTTAPRLPLTDQVFDSPHPVIEHVLNRYNVNRDNRLADFSAALETIWKGVKEVVSKKGVKRQMYSFLDDTECALLARNDVVFREPGNPFFMVAAIAPIPHELRSVLKASKSVLTPTRAYKHLRILPGPELQKIKYLPLSHVLKAELREPIPMHARLVVLDKKPAFVKGQLFSRMEDFTICMGPAAAQLDKQNPKELVHSAEWVLNQSLKRKGSPSAGTESDVSAPLKRARTVNSVAPQEEEREEDEEEEEEDEDDVFH